MPFYLGLANHDGFQNSVKKITITKGVFGLVDIHEQKMAVHVSATFGLQMT